MHVPSMSKKNVKSVLIVKSSCYIFSGLQKKSSFMTMKVRLSKKNKMGGACGTYGRQKRRVQGFSE